LRQPPQQSIRLWSAGLGNQAAGEAAYLWQAESQAHDLERRRRALLRVRQRACQFARAAR
jgi:hypothetical protein